MMNEPTNMLTVAQVATRLGVSAGTVRRYVHNGELDGAKYGVARQAPLRIPEEEVERFLVERGAVV
jgi:excisionase family DNA binding protein